MLKKINSLILVMIFLVGLCPMKIVTAKSEIGFTYLGTDTTTKNHWEGKYGKEGYALLGYQYCEQLGDNSLSELERPYIPVNGYDLIGGSVIKKLTVSNSDNLLGANGKTGGLSIDMPSEKSASGYEISAIAFAKTDTGDPVHNGICEFKFELNDNEEKIFTVYGHETGVYASVVYQFCEVTSGNVIYSKTFDSQPASNGNYASFRVKGDFILKILTQDRQNTVSSFFFDEAKDSPASLQIDMNKGKNSIDISIEDNDEAESYYIVRSNGETTETLCHLRGTEKSFIDTTTIGNTVYTYTLYKYDERGFAKSVDFKYTTPKTSNVTIEVTGIEKINSINDIIPVKITAKAGSTPLKEAKIKLMISGDYIDRKFMEPIVAEVVTDSAGQASYDYQANVAGDFEIYAKLEQNYTTGYSASESERIATTIKLKTYEDVPYILKMSDAIKYDELISVTGEGYSGDLKVKAVAFSGTGNVPSEPPEEAIDVEIVQKDELNAQFMTIRFPKETPSGVYSVWIKNDYGWSEPYTLNDARPLFISEYEVGYGMEIQISGRNLDLRQIGHDEHYTAVRLNDGNGNSYVQEIIKVTPYSIRFKVDERTPLGTYSVEVTNNGGLSWIGLESTKVLPDEHKQSLTVLGNCEDPIGLGLAWVANYSWDNRFNVLDYGANNKDKDGDFEAISNAITAAHESGGGVVYIPNGTYYFDETIPLRAGVVLLGESKEKTILYYNGEDGKHIAASTGDGQTVGHYGMAYFTIRPVDENTFPLGLWHGHPWDGSQSDQKLRTATEIFMKGVDIELNIYKNGKTDFAVGEIDTIMKERYAVQDCLLQIPNGMPCVYVTKYVDYSDNVMRYWGGYTFTSAMFSFVNNVHIDHIKEYATDVKSPRNSHGFFGRSFIHWEDCSVEGLGGWGDSEAFCSEFPDCQFGLGNVLYSEANKVYTYLTGPYLGNAQISNHPTTVRNSYLAIIITSGRGVGQMRSITDFDPDGKWFEISEPWDVMPDTSSMFAIVCPNDRATVYNAEVNGAGQLYTMYGLGYDCVGASLKGQNCTGIHTHNTTVKSTNRVSFGYFQVFRDCEMTGSMQSVSPEKYNICWSRDGETGALITAMREEHSRNFAGIMLYAQELRNIKVICDPEGKLYGAKAAVNIKTLKPEDDKKGDFSHIIMENIHAENAEYGVAVEHGVGNGIVVRNLSVANISSKKINMPEGTEGFVELDDGGATNDGDLIKYSSSVSSTVNGEVVGFEDLENFGWAKDDIELARQRKITNGTAAGKFSPEKEVTRAEFFGFIINSMGFDKVEYKNIFSDVSKTSWYAPFIQVAYTNALIDSNMIEDGKINPEAPITREEMASVLARAIMNKERTLKITAERAGFGDVDRISSYYNRYVDIVKKYGIIIGDDKNNFNPKSLANRAEAVVAVNRFYSYFEGVD